MEGDREQASEHEETVEQGEEEASVVVHRERTVIVQSAGLRPGLNCQDATVADEPDAARRRRAALAGHRGDEETASGFLGDPSPTVRATALGALTRMGRLTGAHVTAALSDADPAVRRRACEEGWPLTEVDLRPALSDADSLVVESAAWALGEREDPTAVDALVAVATGHEEPLAREAAVAALGAIGDARGLAAILRATSDKPAIRRRAVLALAPFDGPEVDAALQRALTDRDWQVRQAAEDLLGHDAEGPAPKGGPESD
jgi:HEAT repeat protein